MRNVLSQLYVILHIKQPFDLELVPIYTNYLFFIAVKNYFVKRSKTGDQSWRSNQRNILCSCSNCNRRAIR